MSLCYIDTVRSSYTKAKIEIFGDMQAERRCVRARARERCVCVCTVCVRVCALCVCVYCVCVCARARALSALMCDGVFVCVF